MVKTKTKKDGLAPQIKERKSTENLKGESELLTQKTSHKMFKVLIKTVRKISIKIGEKFLFTAEGCPSWLVAFIVACITITLLAFTV